MATSKRSLELREDPAFERREWRIQRAGWGVIVVLLVLALAGMFGKGPLSHACAVEGSVQVSYERFVHENAPTTLHIHITAPRSETVRLSIAREYLEVIGLERLNPRPQRVLGVGDRLIYEFAASATDDFRLTIDATPPGPGVARADIRLLGEATAAVHFQQLVYP